MRYHLTPVKMVFIQKAGNNRCWKDYGEKRTYTHCWWECKLATVESSLEISQITQNRTIIQPSNTPTEHISKRK